MAFAIKAEFLLGFYQGRDRFGHAELFPSFSRTFAALVGAAYALTRLERGELELTRVKENAVGRAKIQERIIELPKEYQQAFEWLEHHGPDAITLPPSEGNFGGSARAYRHKGWSQLSRADSPDKPAAAEPAVARSALAGPITWWWIENPPEAISRRIALISNEVPHLGEVASPVQMTSYTSETVPSVAWRRNDEAISIPGAQAFDLPAPGRAHALQQSFSKLSETRVPSLARDRPTQKETDASDQWPSASIHQQVLYAPPSAELGVDEPWMYGYVLRVRPVRPSHLRYWRPAVVDRVGWAEATHRAIVKQLGPDASGLITGRYAPSDRPPANRLTIQILDAGMPLGTQLSDAIGKGAAERAVIFIAVPGFSHGTAPQDLSQIDTALRSLRYIALSSDQVIEVTGLEAADATTIWAPPESGAERWWFPHPLLVAESRAPSHSTRRGRDWTAGDAIRVSVGNVFRDHPALHTELRGDRRLVELSNLVDGVGVRIGSPRRVYPAASGAYVHKINPDAIITTVQGLIHLGPLTSGRALIALGQSRHFGGGLLVPFDIPSLPEVSVSTSGRVYSGGSDRAGDQPRATNVREGK